MTRQSDNPNRIQPWTITQLWAEYQKDLAQCTTALEKSCCQGIAFPEMRRLAADVQKTRKLTPMESAILESIN